MHDHAIERDLVDLPRGGAEEERLAGARLVHHLFVELADARAIAQDHREQPAVGDGAATGDRQALRAGPGAHDVVDAIPHDARAQLAELFGRIAARQHVEHRTEQVVGEIVEVGRAPDQCQQLVDRPILHGAHGDDLLRQHVERIAGIASGFDGAAPHAIDDHRGLDEVAAMLGEHLARGWARPLDDRRARCAADPATPRPATRPGSRDRPRPCRCRVRANSSRPARATDRS